MRNSWYLHALMLLTTGCFAAPRLSHNHAVQLIKHLQVIRELKTLNAQKSEPLSARNQRYDAWWSQTDAHLSFSLLHENVASQWDLFFRKHGQLILEIRENERKYSEDYYVFYHAQCKNFIIIQDFIKEVFELFQMCRHLDSFTFLRFWDQMPLTDVNSFIDKNNSKKDHWFDHEPDIVPLLLSVNLSLFGNCTFVEEWECTFDYFLHDRSVMAGGVNTQKILSKIFEYFGFDQRYCASLLSLVALLESDQGILFQICIPKYIVDDCVYLSHPGGVPYSRAIDESIFDTEKRRHLLISPILEIYMRGIEGVEEIKKNTGLMEYLQEVALSQDLDINDEKQLVKLIAYIVDHLQARILFTRDIMLTPASGVKIFRYTTIPDAAMAEYTKRLQRIVQEVVAEWIEQKNRYTIQGSKLDVLLTQLEK